MLADEWNALQDRRRRVVARLQISGEGVTKIAAQVFAHELNRKAQDQTRIGQWSALPFS